MALGTKRKAANTLSKQPLDLPPATVHAFAGTAAPEGWAMCDGAEVSRTEYAALFAAVGTTYGVGDGSTTFNLPDMRGEFLRGLDNMGTAAGARGLDSDGTARTVGQTQAHELGSHTHRTSAPSSPSDNRWRLFGYSGSTTAYTTGSSGTGYLPLTENTGGTESRPRNMAVNYIIKL